MRERILIMGGPGSGKSTQCFNVVTYLQEIGVKKINYIDLEDKAEATLMCMTDAPKNLEVRLALSWDELKDESDKIAAEVKPDDWIMIDRIDLAWPAVQRWYTENKYEEDLADLMMKNAKNIKKSFMVAPRFDQGSWQVINEQYDNWINKLLYKTRCNIIMTSGVKTDENPVEMFGGMGVMPRGQKELGHQPNSVFLLTKIKERREVMFKVSTAKDLPNRAQFDEEDMFDFGMQYLSKYVQ